MTGPSAIGSLNGTPSSIKVACGASVTRSCSVVARLGSPAVMYGTKPFFPSRFRVVKASAMRPTLLRLQSFAHGIYVFISASGKIHDYDLVATQRARHLQPMRHRVCRLERGNDPFEPG